MTGLSRLQTRRRRSRGGCLKSPKPVHDWATALRRGLGRGVRVYTPGALVRLSGRTPSSSEATTPEPQTDCQAVSDRRRTPRLAAPATQQPPQRGAAVPYSTPATVPGIPCATYPQCLTPRPPLSGGGMSIWGTPRWHRVGQDLQTPRRAQGLIFGWGRRLSRQTSAGHMSSISRQRSVLLGPGRLVVVVGHH